MHNITSPDNSDPSIERQIQAKGLTGPRITPEDIKGIIVSEHYFTAAEAIRIPSAENPFGEAPEATKLLTFCVLVLRNGFTVTVESACASPENFDAQIGKRIARGNAEQKIWPLMGYALKDRLWRDSDDAAQYYRAVQ